MKKLLLLLFIPLAFADDSPSTIHVRMKRIEDFASRDELKAAGISKLKPAQYDALNTIMAHMVAQVAQDVTDQVTAQIEQEILKELQESDDPPTKAVPLSYHKVVDSTESALYKIARNR